MIISFEGGEGSGKGTQVELVEKFLKEKGYKVIIGREPGSVEIAEEIRKVVQKPRKNKTAVLPVAELFLYEAARAQFVEEFLVPSMSEYDVVILDRFFDSTTAYQGYGRELDKDMIYQINYFATRGIKPDLTFVLDVSPEVAMERCKKSEFGERGDRLEQEDVSFHYRVRDGFHRIAEEEPDRVILVDSETNDIDQVFDIIKKKILEHLK